MNGTRRPNSMLVELVIVILFFAISASVILQLFVAAGARSAQSTTDTAALLMAEDFAERFAASKLPADSFLEADGFAQDGDTYMRTAEAGKRTLTLAVTGENEDTGAGVLDALHLAIHDQERVVLTLPVSRYLPREDMP